MSETLTRHNEMDEGEFLLLLDFRSFKGATQGPDTHPRRFGGLPILCLWKMTASTSRPPKVNPIMHN